MPGVITKKELEYNESRVAIPATGWALPLNKNGLIHIWGRNDYSSAVQLGISWEVKNPNNALVEAYSTWELWPYTGAGGTHEFIGGRFPLNIEGTWRIIVSLFAPPDIILDSYSGNLCTVAADGVVESIFSNFLISAYSKVGG